MTSQAPRTASAVLAERLAYHLSDVVGGDADFPDFAGRLLDELTGEGFAVTEAAALPAAPARPMRLFYSGTHGSTCINCDEYVAGELYHIPCFGQCGKCPTIPHCVERKGNEPIFPAAAQPAAPAGLDPMLLAQVLREEDNPSWTDAEAARVARKYAAYAEGKPR